MPFFATAHRDFEIFKKVVFDFCGVQSLDEAKGLGGSMDCLFMRTVRSGTVESFCFRDSILQGILTLGYIGIKVTVYCIINFVRLLLAVSHSSNNGDMQNVELGFLFASRRTRSGRRVTMQQLGRLCFGRNLSKCNGM